MGFSFEEFPELGFLGFDLGVADSGSVKSFFGLEEN